MFDSQIKIRGQYQYKYYYSKLGKCLNSIFFFISERNKIGIIFKSDGCLHEREGKIS